MSLVSETRHILITGGQGQLGIELLRQDWPDDVRLYAPSRGDLDLSDAAAVRRAFAATPFAAVINSGAYTAVDAAEDDVAAAFAANGLGPALLADETRKAGVPLIQVSTDYVFDGSGDRPYVETDSVAPLGVYGASKLAGEMAVRVGNPRSLVLRTAWVFSAHRANFLKTMIRLAQSRPVLNVVSDQYGCPTSATDIAQVLKTITLRLMSDVNAPTGVYHFVNDGEATWAEFATAIVAEYGSGAEVVGIGTADYPTRARRPANSRLSTVKLQRDFGVVPRPWLTAMADVIEELRNEGTS